LVAWNLFHVWKNCIPTGHELIDNARKLFVCPIFYTPQDQ
jgi:hypothetical protein